MFLPDFCYCDDFGARFGVEGLEWFGLVVWNSKSGKLRVGRGEGGELERLCDC